MTKTLIIPGLDGSPAPHWQHWWAASDPKALMVEQADWAKPQPEAWEAEVAGAILNHPGAILVGHSLGAVVIARILTKWPQLRVAGALLVAPAEPSGSTRLARFAPIPERALGVPALVVASRNDPWMGFARTAGLARSWGAELVDMGFAGHINVASGFGPWPQGLALRHRLLAPVALGPEALPQRQYSAQRRLGL
jgi:hypothetical protein